MGDSRPCIKSLHKPSPAASRAPLASGHPQSTRSRCCRDTGRMESRPRSWETQVWGDRPQENLVKHQESSAGAKPELNPCLHSDDRFGRDSAVSDSSAKSDWCHQHQSHSHEEGPAPLGLLLSLPHQQITQTQTEGTLRENTSPNPALNPLRQGQHLLYCEGVESYISQSPWEQSKDHSHNSIYWNTDTIMSRMPGELPQG